MWWSKGKARQATTGATTPASPMIMFLEPRMLFDGAVAATVVDAAQADSHATADAAAKASTADHATASQDTHAQTDAPATPAPVAVPGQAVVFVDARVKDAADLLKGVAPGTQVVQLDASKDGLQQIADYLGSHQGVSSVQIVAHGNSGDLWLGSTYLSADNVAARSAVLAQIGQDMNVGGDILIYACNTAEGDKGISFVDSLASLTGRDIAASSNRTGAGGDWTLEIATGSIENHTALSYQSMSAYQYGLATITVTSGADSGIGSLRTALGSAVAGDTVTFNTPGMTVNLNSQLVITKNLTIEGDLDHNGTPDVTISGQYKTQVLTVNSGVTATLDGLVITKGLKAGDGGTGGSATTAANLLGAGISNFGNLTLNNVTVTANAASGGGGGGGVAGGDVGGGGGGGGAVGGGTGGHGGITSNGSGIYAGTAGTANQGGTGGGYRTMGGIGGSSTGGAGSTGIYGYTNGSAGGTAASGGLSIGGGGGGSGWNAAGGKGGAAAGGIYNASGATLTIVGTSSITGNIGAGGGGGGGSAAGSGTTFNGGDGGLGVGAIWNKGAVLITAANFATLGGTSNTGASGNGGLATAASPGNKPTAVNGLFNDIGATANTAYSPAPTATIVVGTVAQHIGSTSPVTITFNQAVTGFTNADLTIANGTLSAVNSLDGGITWTATFTPSAGTTSATNQIVLDNTGVSSVSTSTAGVGTTTSNNYAIDTVRPTATLSVSAPTLSTTANGTVTITFSEAVAGFSLSDMTASNGTLSNLTTSDNIHWTATLTPTAGNNTSGNVITLDNTLYTDAATNAGSGTTTSNAYVIDTVRPTASIVVATTALNIGGTSLVTITFSEAVTGFTSADLTVANGTVSGLSSSDGGVTWTGTLAATAGITDTTNVITLANNGVSDAAGNTGTGTTDSNNYVIDTQRPTATIVVADNALKLGETSLVTITFSEAVTGFTNADLTIVNGTLTAVSSSNGGITWTATFTPTSNITDTTNLITLDNTGVSDGAGNTGAGSTNSNNYAVDTQRPTATIVLAENALKIGVTSLVTITFSEAVTGLTNADLTIANGTLTAVSSADGGVTWTATFTPTSNVTDSTNLITLDNTGIADQAGNAGSGTTDSNNYAIDTQRPTATIILADPTLSAGETSLVTITFSEAVTGFTNADLAVANGNLSAVSSADGGITWTATFTPTANIRSTTNIITLQNTGVSDLAGNGGFGTSNSGNYVIDTRAPTATIVVADNSLTIGETSLVTITFSEAVTGFSNADLTVANGTLTAVSSADGGITWTATLTPTNAITDTTNLITLDNSGVQNGSGNAGAGTTNSNNYAIDTQRPTATIVVADSALAIGETSQVTITFSEAVTGFTNADLTIANGTLSAVSSSNGGLTWTATFTPTSNVTDSTNLITLDNTGVTDQAGNAGSGTTDSNNYAIDSQRPTATVVIADPTLKAGETTLVTVTFSEAVTGFDNSDLSVANGTLSAVSSSDGGITWIATFTPTVGVQDTTNLITLNNSGISDIAGNAGTGTTNSGNYTIDTVLPTASIVVADNALNAGETSLVTITFSEAVTGFTNADLTIANGTLSAVSSSDGGITWTASFTPTSNITDTTNLITLDNSGVQNASGNAGAGTTNSNNYAIDTARPTATLVVADAALGVGQTSLVTITFSEAVTGFTNADLTVANGTLSAVSSSDGGVTWTATLTPNAGITDTSNVVRLDNTGVQDLAGNTGSGTTDSNNYAIDSQRPTATIVIADPSLSAGETTLVTVTFSEAVTGFDNSDLSVANGTLSAVSSSDGGITWIATFTPTVGVQDTTNLITLNNSGISDIAGNAGTGTTNSGNYTIDTVLPTASIVVADNALNAGETSLVTITFSEAVTGFNNADLTIANGTLSAVSSSDGGITWTATFTPTSNITDTTNLITLDNSGVQNASGNAGAGTTNSNNYAIDTARPTATLVVADAALGVGQTSLVTITFSEAVTGFTNADLTVANGTLSAVSSSDGGITWTAMFAPAAGITATRNLITLNNTGVNDLAGNAGTGTTDSNTYSIDTQAPTATVVIANPLLTAGSTSLVTVTFSEPVTDFDNSDLIVGAGSLSRMTSSDGGRTWTGLFTPVDGIQASSNIITLNNAGVRDLAGNDGSGWISSNAFNIQTSHPTATLEIYDTIINKDEIQIVTVRFSEAVQGFNLSSLQAPNGTFSQFTRYSDTLYTAVFTPNANVTAPNNVITLDTSSVQNAFGNRGVVNALSPVFAIDTVIPTATWTLSDKLLEPGETATVTVTFSERVTGFDNRAIVNLQAATLSPFYSLDGGVTWQATLTPTPGAGSSGSYLIGLSLAYVKDLAGNTNYAFDAGSMITYTVDHTPLSSNVYLSSERLAVGATSTVSIYFNKAVSNFDLSDLSADNGVLSNLRTSDGGISWQATLTPFANTTSAQNVVRLNNAGVTYYGGSTGAGITTSRNYTVDTQRPTSTIVVDKTSLGGSEQATVTITFSEAVEFYNSPQAQNAWLSGLKSVDGGITWTATLTPQRYIEDTSNVVSLDNTQVHDLSGNAGLGTSTSNNYAVDTRPATATIVVDKAVLATGETANVTITFNEAVSGLKLENLSVGSGVLSNLKSLDGGMTWTATLTPKDHLDNAYGTLVLNGQGVTDAAGNSSADTYAYSNYFAVDTQGPQVYIEVSDTQLKAGQGTQVFIWFSEPVRGFDLSSLKVPNGTLSNLQSGEGGYYWTATLTPNNNVNVSANIITVDNSTIRDLAGNVGEGISQSNAYAINSVTVTADPLTLTGAVARPVTDIPNLPLQPGVFAPPSGNLGSPLTFAPLFEQRVLGDGIRPLGDIFINNGATSPSFIAQVFTSSDNVGDGSGKGFLGFGGGDGGMFGTSTFSSLFNRETGGDGSSLKSFDSHSIKGQGDPAQGLRGVFGAPTLGQQLQQLKDIEHRQVMDLAQTLQQVGISEMQA
ncbi:Ig-like domain-containing protein [Pseudomonas fluorescens]|uniref:Ig-like domain-containing protein n=4 Tax=Pseudomonas TaxID=286 RepID=UPI003837DFC1